MNDSKRPLEDLSSVPTSPRAPLPRQASCLLAGLCAGALVALAPQATFAQGRLDAHYEASLSGIPVGHGSWTIQIGDDGFSASAQGPTAGLLKAFAGGTGSGGSPRRVVHGAPGPARYAPPISSKKSRTLRVSRANGN